MINFNQFRIRLSKNFVCLDPQFKSTDAEGYLNVNGTPEKSQVFHGEKGELVLYLCRNHQIGNEE